MSITEGLVIFIVGIAAGFANTVAGGGSLLSLPVLIFMGLPSSVANATNRVAIIMQNIFAVSGFKSKGVSTFPYSLYLGLSALVGAIIGARIAVDISSDLFNQILSIVMLLVVIMTIFNPFKKTQQIEEIMTFNRMALALVVFFFIGIYGGFIQAGVGFLMIAALTSINGFSLVKTNSAKVFVALIYTSAAIIVFIIEDQINWEYGIVLATGNSLGGWIGSRWSVNKGDKWIKRFLVVTVVALAVKLWFFN
ncbi:MAG: sulfite exporter TauE/SafE family protein [Bacteroidetes bacterium]|nr:sulfite exporter TauE/SafE family protein [Bacteroidota bacterium]